MDSTVLVITDQTEQARLLANVFIQAGTQVVVLDCALAPQHVANGDLARYDLVLINMFEQDNEGLAICRSLRPMYSNPILFLSYERSERFHVQAYDAGADEFVLQPISIHLLLAKYRAWLRRASGERQHMPALKSLGFRLDSLRKEVVTPDERVVKLSALEMRLFQVFVRNSGRTLEAETIIRRVWADSNMEEGDKRILKSLVHRLRRKIERNPDEPEYIHTVPRYGYIFAAANESHS